MNIRLTTEEVQSLIEEQTFFGTKAFIRDVAASLSRCTELDDAQAVDYLVGFRGGMTSRLDLVPYFVEEYGMSAEQIAGYAVDKAGFELHFIEVR